MPQAAKLIVAAAADIARAMTRRVRMGLDASAVATDRTADSIGFPLAAVRFQG